MSTYHVAKLFQHNHFPSHLTPAYIRFALLLQGMDFPIWNKTEPLRYLELGPGQGKRLNLHTAVLPEWEFWGLGDTASNTADSQHIAQATQLANHILDISIEELARQGIASDIPQFDIIAIDAAWTRVDEKNRQHILDILNCHLKTGGIACIGYNAMPGCAELIPLRDLLLRLMQISSTDGSIFSPLESALSYTDAYSNSDSVFFIQAPTAKAYFESMKTVPYAQLEDEIINPQWKPFYFSEVAKYLESARCSFVTSLNLSSQLDMCQPEAIVPLLHEEEDVILKETMRDYALNQQTRLDIFSRGSSKPSPEHIERALDSMAFCLTAPRNHITAVTLPSPSGDLVFDDDIYMAFLDALAEDSYRPKTLPELKAHPLLIEQDDSLFLAIINILVAAGLVFPVKISFIPESEQACARLNRILCESSRDGKSQPALASPVLHSGIAVSRILQMFLLAWADGATQPASCAQAVLAMLTARKEQFIRENGQPLTEAEMLATLEADALLFFENTLPYLEAMQALPALQNP